MRRVVQIAVPVICLLVGWKELPAKPLDAVRLNYMLNCQGCHLADGRGMPGKVPDMRGQLGKFLLVEGGREFLVQVPGTANSGLSDAETSDLLNWLVKAMGSDPGGFRPFSTIEIAKLRSVRIRDVTATRADLLREIRKVEN